MNVESFASVSFLRFLTIRTTNYSDGILLRVDLFMYRCGVAWCVFGEIPVTTMADTNPTEMGCMSK